MPYMVVVWPWIGVGFLGEWKAMGILGSRVVGKVMVTLVLPSPRGLEGGVLWIEQYVREHWPALVSTAVVWRHEQVRICHSILCRSWTLLPWCGVRPVVEGERHRLGPWKRVAIRRWEMLICVYVTFDAKAFGLLVIHTVRNSVLVGRRVEWVMLHMQFLSNQYPRTCWSGQIICCRACTHK
jgi:hypothetical protein